MTKSNKITAHHNDPSKAILGFWIYLMTDLLLFASLFATYAVLRHGTAGGPSGRDIFDMPFVLTETLVLLTSSFTAGFTTIFAKQGKKNLSLLFLGMTFALGAIFLGMEIYEFSHLVGQGYAWHQSAFLSAFFTLVGTHGLHILAGLIWASVMFFRINKQGLTANNLKRLGLFAMFWHFLDIVWIFIFTFVYMLGVA